MRNHRIGGQRLWTVESARYSMEDYGKMVALLEQKLTVAENLDQVTLSSALTIAQNICEQLDLDRRDPALVAALMIMISEISESEKVDTTITGYC
jgi:hypothetical protein